MSAYKKLIPIPESGMQLADKPILFVLVGLPGSGKSTWAQQTFGWQVYDEHVVSMDYFVDLYAQQKGKTYDQVWLKASKDAEKKMNERAAQLIKDKKLIIWDQTNLSAKKRKAILSRIPKAYKKYVVVFNIEESVRQVRVKKRADDIGKSIPEDVIASMKKSFEFPDIEKEKFDDIAVI